MNETPLEGESRLRVPMRWPLWVWLGILIFILALAAVWIWQSGMLVGYWNTARVGSPAPEIRLTQLENGNPGQRVALSALTGRPVVVLFWATWCKACQEEFPVIESLYRKYKDSQQLSIIGVSWYIDDDPENVQQFINQMGTTFPIWLDTGGAAARAYRAKALPTTVFIDRHGVIQDIVVGPMSVEYLEKQLQKIFD